MSAATPRTKRILSAILLASTVATIAILLVMLLRLPHRFRGLEPGAFLPDFVLVSPEGEQIHTGTWRGRPTLLVLFDPSCPSCLSELDNIEALAPTLPRLRVVALWVGRPGQEEMTFVAYRDPTGALTRSARRFAVPALYWIGVDGRIEYARSGARSFPEDAAIFSGLLAKGGPPGADSMAGPARHNTSIPR
jgi:hypothetical protein